MCSQQISGELVSIGSCLERRALQTALSALPKAHPRRLVMDEFALFKGHRYASVVLDANTRRVLWIGEGRSRAAARPFYEELGPEGCARIEAVAMGMSTAFDLEVRQHCPKARVVYDLFHVVAKYGREVIDRVRVDEVIRSESPAALFSNLRPSEKENLAREYGVVGSRAHWLQGMAESINPSQEHKARRLGVQRMLISTPIESNEI
jgi:transposase